MMGTGKLDGKIALLVANGDAVGRALARRFAAEGARLVVAAGDEAAAAALCDALDGPTPVVFCTALDVRQEQAWNRLMAKLKTETGRLDCFVNALEKHAGSSLLETSAEAFEAAYALNIEGRWLGLRAAAPVIRASGGGAIVTVCADDGIKARPGHATQTAAAGALSLMTKAIALEFANPPAVRVNAVHYPAPAGSAAEGDATAAAVLAMTADDCAFATGTDFVLRAD